MKSEKKHQPAVFFSRDEPRLAPNRPQDQSLCDLFIIHANPHGIGRGLVIPTPQFAIDFTLRRTLATRVAPPYSPSVTMIMRELSA